jgi:hypothetical protein
MATNAVLTMEGDSVESCGKPAFTKKNWASKAWATVGDIANSVGRIVFWGQRALHPSHASPLPAGTDEAKAVMANGQNARAAHQ